MQGEVFTCLNITTLLSILDGIQSGRGPTCLGGSKADNKRLSGESINISWSIIWVLILANDCNCISPADKHITTSTLLAVLRLNILVYGATKWHEYRHTRFSSPVHKHILLLVVPPAQSPTGHSFILIFSVIAEY